MDIDTNAVEVGMAEIKNAEKLVQDALKLVNSASYYLNSKIAGNISGFKTVKDNINISLNNSSNIIDKGTNFIEDATKTVSFLGNISSTEDVLNLRRGPLNTTFLQNPESFVINNDNSIEFNSSDDILSEDEFNRIMLAVAYENEGELPPELIKSMIAESEYLSEADKEYINSQLDICNIRSAIGYILEMQAREELEAKIAIREKCREEKENFELAYRTTNGQYQLVGNEAYNEAYERWQQAIQAVKQQEMIVNRYANSRKEWEYDCYFKLIGTDGFEQTTTVYKDFYKAAISYYSSEDNFLSLLTFGNNIGKAIWYLIPNDNSKNSFIKWLNSDTCTLENKDELITFYNENVNNEDTMRYGFTGNKVALGMALLELSGEWAANPSDNSNVQSLRDGMISDYNIPSELRFLDEEHIKVYSYIYATEGCEKASEYIHAMGDLINRESGFSKANDAFYNIVNSENSSGVLGLLSADWEGIKLGTEQWFDVVGQIFSKTGLMTDSEYAVLYLNNMLGGLSYFIPLSKSELESYKSSMSESSYNNLMQMIDNGENITYMDVLHNAGQLNDNEYNNFHELLNDPIITEFIENTTNSGEFLGMNKLEWLNTMFNAGVTTGNMLPSIVASLATSGVLGVGGAATSTISTASRAAGLSLMFLYSTSSAKNESLRSGRSLVEAWTYGILNGASETVTEYLIGGIPFVSKVHKWAEISPTSKTSAIILRTILNVFVLEPLAEITEEELQASVFDYAIKMMAYGESDYEFNLEQAIQIAITTYLSTAQLQAISVVVPTAATIKRSSAALNLTIDGQEIQLTYGELLDCIDEETGQISKENIADILQEKLEQTDSPIQLDDKTRQEMIEQFKSEHKDLVVDVHVLGDICSIETINGSDIDAFNIPLSELNSPETINKLKMLSNPFYLALRDRYLDKIADITIENGAYQITTIYGDVISVDSITGESFDSIQLKIEKMTDFDYTLFKMDVEGKIKSVDYDVARGKYIVRTINDDIFELDYSQILSGDASMIISSSLREEIIQFKQQFGDKIIDVVYTGCGYAITINEFGDAIYVSDLNSKSVAKRISHLTNESYLEFRRMFGDKIKLHGVDASGYYSIEINGYSMACFDFDQSMFGTQQLIDSVNMFLSDEYRKFSDETIMLFGEARRIQIIDGKYHIERLTGETLIVENGQLNSENVLKLLHVDKLFERYENYISNISQDANGAYVIELKSGDKIVATLDEMKTTDFENQLRVLNSTSYLEIKGELGSIISKVSVNGNNCTISTIYGDEINIALNLIESNNFLAEMLLYKYRHEAFVMEDGNYCIINRFGDRFIVNPTDFDSGAFLHEIVSKTDEHAALLINDWLINNIESLGTNLTADQQAVVNQQLQDIADRVGATVDEVRVAINTALGNIVEESNFGNRVSLDVLQIILDSHIKNQHETGTSNGAKNPQLRRALESSHFLVPSEVDAQDAAVYGMMFPSLDNSEDYNATVDYYKNGPGYWYGSGSSGSSEVVIIYNKSAIMENTSMTIGDSLDYSRSGVVQGTSVSSPQFTGAFPGFLNGVSSLDEIENANLTTFAPQSGGDQYIEIQVHGRYAHLVDVIQEVIFLKQPSSELTNQLDSLGIKWRIITQ